MLGDPLIRKISRRIRQQIFLAVALRDREL